MPAPSFRTDRVRFLVFVKRSPELSYQEFSETWLDNHSKVVLDFVKTHPDTGVVRYEQLHVNQEEKAKMQRMGGPTVEFDGVESYDVESAYVDKFLQSQFPFIPSSNTSLVLRTNIATVIDHDEDLLIASQMGTGGSSYWKLPTRLRRDRVRMLFLFQRMDGMSREAMTKHWLDVHTDVVVETIGKRGVLKYEQLHLPDEEADKSRWDGLAMIDASSFEAFKHSQDRKPLAEDGAKWLKATVLLPVDVATIIDTDYTPAYEASLLLGKL